MEKVVLKAVKRNVTGKQVKALRREGKLPAVIYGRHVEPISIAMEAHSAGLALGKLTSSSLVTISVEGAEYPALVRERQRDYIKGTLTHVDFLAVDMNEKIRASVGLVFVGVSPAVKDYNGILVHNLERLEVECFPGDLPERIEVDIAMLKQIGDLIRVHDVHVSDKIRILGDPEETIAVVTIIKEETAPVAAEGEAIAAAEPAAPELSVERGKKAEEGEEEKK
ncbi:MAG: 50S ribosomal protein L25 [Chloroflexi bacterium]|nr:50S ribosomal protein L25 [Chloroflexi bacterium CFX1]MCK6568744.1 50S ribosomal protein L25 [Anaerolineales bacterium]MCQ3954226.1 50S ribosomal protein L25 [Chloroflexota bacterium]MDL1920659.1 50S ribosomal protein L25 [Chloroflexi bacterium CFX5]NUQ59954.1 50S ribosomal protein L25 [Anaerolineales bacterium]